MSFGGDYFEGKGKMNGPTNIIQYFCKVADGHLTTTVKVLGSSEVVLYNENIMKVLGVKYSYISPPSMLIPFFLSSLSR